MTEARLKNQLRNRGSQRRPLWFAPPCAGRFARRDRPSRAGSRCQTLNRTPKRRHALDTSSADARAPANPRRARRVHAKSRRRKRSYPRRSPRPLCPRISILVLAKRTTGTTCFFSFRPFALSHQILRSDIYSHERVSWTAAPLLRIVLSTPHATQHHYPTPRHAPTPQLSHAAPTLLASHLGASLGSI